MLTGLRSLTLTPLALIFAASCAKPASDYQQKEGVVSISDGDMKGVVSGDVESFKGIRYAAPPLGELRWREPQPAKPWDGVFDASEYGNDCMQVPFPSDAAPLGTPPAEDCLFLNVWRPADAEAGDELPVLVWIYGGGFVNGGSSPAVYDGSSFAEKDVVFVSFNYRLGRFGFFAHPALTAAAEGPLGNYGYMDQIAALNWVQDNIAAFGGDPDKVTIIGESAGGGSVLNLMTTPAAEGLFDQAVVMSGGGRALMGNTRKMSDAAQGQLSAEEIGMNFAKSVGVDGIGPEALVALRALSAEDVRGDLNMVALFQPPPGPPTYAGGPFVDGEIVIGATEAQIKNGAIAGVPIMIGTTGQDLGFSLARTKDELFASFSPYADRARGIYDPDGSAEFRTLGMVVGADRGMHEPARFIAKEASGNGDPAYFYRFTYVAESMRPEWAGAPHATDIPFFFDTVAAKYGEALTEKDASTADAANAYLVNFTKTGDPNGQGLPQWSVFDADKSNVLDFTLDDGPVEMTDPWKARLDVVEDARNASGG